MRFLSAIFLVNFLAKVASASISTEGVITEKTVRMGLMKMIVEYCRYLHHMISPYLLSLVMMRRDPMKSIYR